MSSTSICLLLSPVCLHSPRYDCSSGDLNPIGSISKQDLRAFMSFLVDEFYDGGCSYSSRLRDTLRSILGAPPSAELTPLSGGKSAQTDEADIGLTYEDLSILGRLRKQDNCGPLSMYQRLVESNNVFSQLGASIIADKVGTNETPSNIRFFSKPPDTNATDNCQQWLRSN